MDTALAYLNQKHNSSECKTFTAYIIKNNPMNSLYRAKTFLTNHLSTIFFKIIYLNKHTNKKPSIIKKLRRGKL